MSVDNGARKSNSWLDQWQSGKLSTGSRVQSFPRAFPSSTDVLVLLLNQSIKRRRRRLRKRHLKSEFALVQTLLRLFHLVLFRQMLANFLKLNQQRSIAQVPKELRFATLSRVLPRVADSLTLKACSQACAINNYCTGHETF